MYFIFTFDINKSLSTEKRDETVSSIQTALTNYKTSQSGRYVRPISNFMLFECNDNEKRKKFITDIRSYTDSNKGHLTFLVSPLINSDRGFIGLIKKDHHLLIQAITKNDIIDELDTNLFF